MKHITLYSCIIFALFSCKQKKQNTKFSYVNSNSSGIVFNNKITENDSINVVTFQYTYNGGGVGIGDFNNDGLSDVVFTGNQVASQLYLNLGNFKFKNITKASSIITKSWVTGVSIVDINADGWDDIYLSVGGVNCNNDCNNLLYINKGLNINGIPTFIEQAKAYQLDDANYSQQTIFFDYDTDGDLDAFITHNGNVKFDKNSPVPKHYMPSNLTDVLLENTTVNGINHPVFKNVSNSLGITYKGFSLGVGINDFNNDNLPDIYVSNDFITEDLLYLNNGTDSITKKHKGFTEANKQFISHQTYNAMGVDIADINNDALPDVLVLDMLPDNYTRQKRMLGSMNYDKFLFSKKNNYNSQFMHNTLQLHNGFKNNRLLKASEVAYNAGIAKTDWSWAPLLADFDNDGDKDVFITNGYVKDITDLDFINFSTQNTMFGNQASKNNQLLKLLKDVPGVKLPNYFYENTGSIKFNNVSTTWKDTKNSFSNGAAYADLDNDGDLDLVVNNINENAFLIQNNTKQTNYLRVKLIGTQQNRKAIGAKITLWQKGKVQQQYQSVIRGYLSSVESIIHFGLQDSAIDSIKVVWPDGKISKLKNPKTNTRLDINYNTAKSNKTTYKNSIQILTNSTSILNHTHKENAGHDYTSQHLLMRQYSKLGPCIASANIDGKPGDEVFIGGSKGKPSTVWIQDNTGQFIIKQELNNVSEATDAAFIDIDNDGDLDLYVANGGSEFSSNSEALQDNIYTNDGKGYFTLTENKLPKISEISACVKPNDFDKDGDVDFFIGSRLVKGSYPKSPKSQLLVNTSSVFKNEVPLELQNIGMVTDASWQDLNNDGWDDLVIVGEWMPVTVFLNKKGVLEKANPNFVSPIGEKLETSGWWNTIAAGDFDNDGDIDFIAGNQGENSFVNPKPNKPIYVYTKDFDNNGSIDPIVAQYYGAKLLPVHTRDDVMKQLVKLKDRYLTYKAFSNANFIDLLNIKDLNKETLKATTFASSYIENLGGLKFKISKLPETCQIAPINNVLVKDLDNDGYLDALLVGNDTTGETIYGQTDALIGIYLKGSVNGFISTKQEKSGFYVPEQSHHISTLQSITGESLIIATQNNNKTKVFTINKSHKND